MVVVCTALAALFRAVSMVVFNVSFMRLFFTEAYIIWYLPPITVFNLTEPLYVIPLGYFIATRVGSYLKVERQKSETAQPLV